MPIDPRQLRAFLTVVDHGSVGRAAEILGQSQSSLSRIIRSVEDRLRIPLFDRHTKGMVLTPAGESFLPYARMLLFEMDQALDVLAEVRGLKRGHLRIGVVSSIASTLMPEVIAKLRVEEPGLNVSMVEDDTGSLLVKLLRREIDLVIAGDEEHDGVEPVAELDFREQLTVVCHASHPLASLPKVTVHQVTAERWILPQKGKTTRRILDQRFKSLGRQVPEAVVEADTINTYLALIRSCNGLGWMASKLTLGSDIVPINAPELTTERQYFLYRRQKGLLPAPARRLLDFLPIQRFKIEP